MFVRLAKPIDLEVGGKYVVIMNRADSERLGLRCLDRVRLKHGGKNLTAVIEETDKFTIRGEIVTDSDFTRFFNLKGG